MADEIVPPFSARNRGAHAQVDNDCPETTRIGLLHILYRLVGQEYVPDWPEVAFELQRIARIKPNLQGNARNSAEEVLFQLPWEKVFDFCERLYNFSAQQVTRYNQEHEVLEVITSRSAVQEYIASELQRLFLEEHLAFEFSNGIVRRRGRRHTANQIAGADLVLGDPRFSSARMHYNKAQKYFRNMAPDYDNVVKEGVCAVEAVARVLFPSEGSTLGEVTKSITGSEAGQLPKTIAKTFDGLYGFRGSGQGVGHGGTDGGAVTKELAEYALAVAASQIILLVDMALTLEPDVPF